MSNDSVKELRDLQGPQEVRRGAARPVRWGELADVIEIFTPAVEASLKQLFDFFGWLVARGIVVPGQPVTLDSKLALTVISHAMPLLGKAPELLRAVHKVSAMLSDRTVADVAALDPDDGLRLALEVYEVNQDFFRQRLLPAARDAWGRTNGRWTPPSVAAGEAAGAAASSN